MIAEAPAFPDDLRALEQWICWRYEEKDGRRTKIPYDPRTGRRASSTSAKTWRSYDEAVAGATAYDGIGFVFARGGGVVGVDLDHCAEGGAMSPEARRVVEAFDTYTELSPSGSGIHLFVRGALPPGKRRRGGYEIYEEGRYFTVTGNQIPGTPSSVNERQPQIDQFHAWVAARDDGEPPPTPRSTPAVSYSARIDDADLVHRALRAKNGELFEALWRGDATKYGGDHSSADLALCNVLAFWTGGDPVRVDRLFRQSGLYRPKWDERRGETTYGDRTIDLAITSLSDVYEPSIELGKVIWRSRNGTVARVDPETGEILEDEETVAGDAPRFEIHWAAEAIEPQPPMVWTIENVAAPGTVNLWVGSGGTLKTYSLLDMLVHVPMGLAWLNLAVVAGPALIVDEESGPRRLKRRLGEVMRAHGSPASLCLAFVSLSALNLRDERDYLHLDGLVEHVRPAIVLVDALADVMPGGDENAVSDTQPVFGALRRIAEKWDTSIHVIHHSNKVGGYRGSTAIQAAVDLMVMVERAKTGDQITLTTAKTRDVEPFALTVQPHFENDGVDKTFDLERVENAAPTAEEPKFSRAESAVIRYLLTHGRGEIGAVAAAGAGADLIPETVRRSVYHLRDKGIVVRVDDGGMGAKSVYELADFANQERLKGMLIT